MSQNNAQIGKAWSAHRRGHNADAIREFEQVVRSDSNNVDAYYGLGLAQRANGQLEEAAQSFIKGLALAEQRAAQLRGERHDNHLETLEDDRYMMLIRMFSQRLEETRSLQA